MVNKKDFDALIIAAPDHWHAPAAILGVTHGKHVYVEKPCGHNPYEGELLVQAMKKYPKQLIQMGNQRRSMPNLIEAVRLVKEEELLVMLILAKPGMPTTGSQSALEKKFLCLHTLDFDLMAGTCATKRLQRQSCSLQLALVLALGHCETCNNGTHEIDMCRWFLGMLIIPLK